MLYYINVNPANIRTNRELKSDLPCCTIQPEDGETIECYEVSIPGQSCLKYFKEGERNRLGAHVSLVAEGPIYYLLRHSGNGGWHKLP